MTIETHSNQFFGLLTALGLLAGAAFFSYAAIEGEYGLFRLFQVRAIESRLAIELQDLQDDRAKLANRTKRLSNQYLDLDLLDEQSRKVLGMARGDEIVVR